MLVLYDIQPKEGIGPGIGMAGTDYNLFDKWTEQVDSLIDESLTIGSKQCLVAAKSTAAPPARTAPFSIVENGCVGVSIDGILTYNKGQRYGHCKSRYCKTGLPKG